MSSRMVNTSPVKQLDAATSSENAKGNVDRIIISLPGLASRMVIVNR